MATGIYVLFKGRRHLVNILFFLMTLFLALWAIGDAMTISASTLQGKVFWTRFQGLGELPLIPTYLVIALYFPHRRRPVRGGWREVATVTALYLPFFLSLVFLYTTGWVYSGYYLNGNLHGVNVVRTPFFWFLTLLGFAFVLISMYLYHREGMRKHAGPERKGLKILALAPVPMLAANVVQNLQLNGIVTTPQFSIAFSVLIAYGILRYGIFVDSRSVTKGVLAYSMVIIANLCLILCLGLFLVYGLGFGLSWPLFLAFALCAVPVFVAYRAEISWAERFVSHHVYEREMKVGKLLRDFSAHIRTVSDMEVLTSRVAEVVRESLGLTFCALVAGDASGVFRTVGFASRQRKDGRHSVTVPPEATVFAWERGYQFEDARGTHATYWKVGKSLRRNGCSIHYMQLGITRRYGGRGEVTETLWRETEKEQVISVSLEAGGQLVGFLWLGNKLYGGGLSLEELDNVVALTTQVSISLRNAQLVQELKEKSERLRYLAHGVSTAQEEERIRVSRELHDGLAPCFLDILFKLEDLERNGVLDQEAARHLLALKEEARRGLGELRRMIAGLRPSSLEVLGLRDTLASYLERFGVENGLEVEFRSWGDLGGLDHLTEVTLYRIAQEALSNVARHAAARKVKLSLGSEDGRVKVEVEDDGVGFLERDVRERIKEGRCLGIRGMEERAELVHGELAITTAPGMGTRVSFYAPLNRF